MSEKRIQGANLEDIARVQYFNRRLTLKEVEDLTMTTPGGVPNNGQGPAQVDPPLPSREEKPTPVFSRATVAMYVCSCGTRRITDRPCWGCGKE